MEITTPEIKHQLRIDDDNTQDDVLIDRLILVAIEVVALDLDRPLYLTDDALQQSGEAHGMVITETVKQAIIIMAGHLYDNPDMVTTEKLTETPKAYGHMIGLYKRHAIG